MESSGGIYRKAVGKTESVSMVRQKYSSGYREVEGAAQYSRETRMRFRGKKKKEARRSIQKSHKVKETFRKLAGWVGGRKMLIRGK